MHVPRFGEVWPLPVLIDFERIKAPASPTHGLRAAGRAVLGANGGRIRFFLPSVHQCPIADLCWAETRSEGYVIHPACRAGVECRRDPRRYLTAAATATATDWARASRCLHVTGV